MSILTATYAELMDAVAWRYALSTDEEVHRHLACMSGEDIEAAIEDWRSDT